MRNAVWIAAASILVAAPVFAQSNAFPFGEPNLGKKVLAAKCSACHVARFGGDGSGVFTRAKRKVSGTQSLLAWVQRCSTANRLELNGEEEESVAAYLNQAYYKFK